MNFYNRFRKSLIKKAVIIPLVVTMLVTAVALLAVPVIRDILPDSSSYSQQNISAVIHNKI